jgi:hypothetical protein
MRRSRNMLRCRISMRPMSAQGLVKTIASILPCPLSCPLSPTADIGANGVSHERGPRNFWVPSRLVVHTPGGGSERRRDSTSLPPADALLTLTLCVAAIAGYGSIFPKALEPIRR